VRVPPGLVGDAPGPIYAAPNLARTKPGARRAGPGL